MSRLFRRERIPLLATSLTLVALYAAASLAYDGFCSPRVVANLLGDNAFLGVTAIGMTFVILSGGIDLSIGAALAFSATLIAALVSHRGWHPLPAFGVALAIGTAFGAAMGALIHAFRMPPFLVTLGGMFLARGMAFVVHMQSIGIQHPFYDQAQSLRLPLVPARAWLVELGLDPPRQAWLPLTASMFLILFVLSLIALHYTRFGRNVYALGGGEDSALLMGLPVGRTRVGVYAFNGFCSALAGVVATFYMGSGNPAMGFGLELDAIAAVVIGGALLTGGVGGVGGTLLGLLILGVLQMALVFDGRLTSWWARVATGALLLVFILLQRWLALGAAGTRAR